MGISADSQLALPLQSQSVSLTADNQVVTLNPGDRMVLITSDNTTATNRTFTLAASAVVGHLVHLVLVSGASSTAEMADTSIQKLSAAWTPVQYGTLTLLSDGTNWIEVARSAN